MNYSTYRQTLAAAFSIVLVPAAALASEAAHAAEGGHAAAAHVDFSTLLWPTVNFVLYLLLVRYLMRRYGVPALRAYSASVRAQLEHAGSLLELSRGELKQTEERLNNVQMERTAVIKELEVEGDRMVEAVLAHAKKAAQQKDADTERQIQSEFNQARAEIRAQILGLAFSRARSKLQAQLSADEDRSIRRAVLSTLE